MINIKRNPNVHQFHIRGLFLAFAAFSLLGLSACQAIFCPDPPAAAAASTEVPTQHIVNIIPDTVTPTATVVPSATPTPIKASSIEMGLVKADWLPYDLSYQVYLPEGYQEQPAACYPLLILLHGQSSDESQWLDLGIQARADALMRETHQPFLIVMPREIYYLQEMEESFYGRAVGDLLIAHIQEDYPVCQARTQHAVGGISRGASWAVQIAFIYPDNFGIIGAHSLPPHRNDIYKLPYWVKDLPDDETLAFYIDTGIYDSYLEAAQLFESYLVKYHVPHEFHLNEGIHDKTYWQAHLAEYLVWYAAQFHEPISSD